MTPYWSPSLIATIRAELNGNTRDDLLHWARRVLRKPPTKAELAKARLVLQLDAEHNNGKTS